NGTTSTNDPESTAWAAKNPLVPVPTPETRETATSMAPLVERISTGPKESLTESAARMLSKEIKPFPGMFRFAKGVPTAWPVDRFRAVTFNNAALGDRLRTIRLDRKGPVL